MKRFHKPKKQALPQSVNVTIEKFSHDGRGLARLDGRVVLVDNAVPGETCQVRIQKGNSRLWQGVAFNRQQDGLARVKPECQAYQQCGGCQLQHLSHESQLALKQEAVQDHLNRHQVEVAMWMPPVVSLPYQYRHRVRLHVSPTGEVGFHAAAQNKVVSFQHCLIMEDSLQQQVNQLRESAPLAGISQIELTVDDNQRPGLSVVKATSKGRDMLLEWAVKQGWCIKAALTYHSGDVTVYARPGDFTQVNRAVNQAMLVQAANWLELTDSDRLLDLFCGNGNLGLALAVQAGSVMGFEVGTEAIQYANKAAVEAGLPAQFFEKDLFTSVLHEDEALQEFAPDCVVLDPPRAGALKVCESLGGLTRLKRMLYISCDPATLARDLQVLGQSRWRVVKAGLLDMFPQTRHIETMVLLEKRAGKKL